MFDLNAKEYWQDIYEDGVKPIYKVSTYGRVKNKITKIILKPMKNKKGYLRVGLSTVYGKTKHFFIHKLVLTHFCPARSIDEDTINHIDGNKENNHLYNLEYLSNYDNIQHAKNNNLLKTCEDHYFAKHDNKTVHDVCKLLQNGKTYDEIIHILNFKNTQQDRRFIRSIWHREKWNDISKYYSWNDSNFNRTYDDELINEICILISKNLKYKEILNSLNLPYINKYMSLIKKIKYKKQHIKISNNYF